MRRRGEASNTVPTKDVSAPKATKEPKPPKATKSVDVVEALPASNEIDDELRPQVKAPVMATDLQRIVTTTFNLLALDELADQLEDKLRAIKPSRCDYGTIADALDEAQENARLAMQLLVNAKHAHDCFVSDAQLVESGMREFAMHKLQGEKNSGARSKAITDADVVAMMATHFPDEWQATEQRKSQARRTVAYLEDLCERLRERARDLRALVSNARG